MAVAKSLKKALAAYERGDLAKAESLCVAALRVQPGFFDALHLLAVVQSRRGRHAAALASFEEARKLKPADAALLGDRASALAGAKRYEEALAGYAAALAVRPDYAQAHDHRGSVLMEMRRYDEALASYGKAVVLDPDNAAFVNNLGRAFTRLRRYAEALDCYADALALRPHYTDALINRGITLGEIGRYDEALACLEAALAQAADHPDALLNRANILYQLERSEDALATYDRLLARHPGHREALLKRGLVLTALQRFDAAFASYDRALAAQADVADVWVNRARTLARMRRVAEAVEAIDRALALRPDHTGAHTVRGIVLMGTDRLAEAIDCFRKALALGDDHAEAAWHLGYLLLLAGQYREGWQHYEARRMRKGTMWAAFKGPQWSGEPLAGKRLLLYAEQGFGDTLQFARFVRVAARLGAQVMFGVYRPLAALFTQMDEKPLVIAAGDALPDYDYHAPIMSMPLLLGLRDESDIPAEVPYLRAEAARVAAWGARLPQATFRVGIAWQGSKTDPARWAPLAAFAPLSRVPGVTLISLQKSDGLAQLDNLPAGMTVMTLGADFDAGPDAFLDTAAVMMNLDLIVSIDTAIPHLAGALGRPVFVALKYRPDWRWLLDRSDSPWYPSARLFRQRKDGEWSDVMAEIAAELARLVSRRSEASPCRTSAAAPLRS